MKGTTGDTIGRRERRHCRRRTAVWAGDAFDEATPHHDEREVINMDVWRIMLGGGWSRGRGLEISLEEEEFGLRACVLCLCAVGLRVD